MSWYIEEQLPIYLDYNATTPLDNSVKRYIIEGLELWANPGSMTPLAEKARSAIEEAKENLGQLLNVSKNEIFFASGGTEVNNWIIHSAIQNFKYGHERCNLTSKPHVISSEIDHPSILKALHYYEEKGEIDISLVPVDPSTGQVDIVYLSEHITHQTCLVTVMLANNETGVIQPIKDISNAVREKANEYGTKILIHSDASQAVGKIDVDINKLKVDAITVVGHKFYGPRNGALVIRNSHTVVIHPMIHGGGQQNNMRSGTENTPMIMGLGMAAKIAKEGLPEFSAHLLDIRDYFEEQLQINLPDQHVIHFAASPRLPNTSSVAFPTYCGVNYDLLDKCKTFQASTGATCCAGDLSTVLLSCGVTEDLVARTVRFSFGRETTREDVDRVIKELKAIIFLSKFGSSLMGALNKGPGIQF